MYMDPPYATVDVNSFVGYSTAGFDKNKHAALFDVCLKMKDRQIEWAMSNADVELVMNNFNDPEKFKIKKITAKRSINSKNPGAVTGEVIISSTV